MVQKAQMLHLIYLDVLSRAKEPRLMLGTVSPVTFLPRSTRGLCLLILDSLAELLSGLPASSWECWTVFLRLTAGAGCRCIGKVLTRTLSLVVKAWKDIYMGRFWGLLHQGCSRVTGTAVSLEGGCLSQEDLGIRDSGLMRLEPSEVGLSGAQQLPV